MSHTSPRPDARVAEETCGLLVRSYERPDYFRRCLDALTDADLTRFMDKFVYDDASSHAETLKLLRRAETLGFRVVRSSPRQGQLSMCAALEEMSGLDFICSLDNDMIVKPHFLSALRTAYDRIRSALDVLPEQLLLSGFNCTAGAMGGHITLDETWLADGYVEKASCGGASLFFHRALLEDVIRWWRLDYDWGVVHGLVRRGGRIFALSPSVAQHIGEYGDNSNGVCDRAQDF